MNVSLAGELALVTGCAKNLGRAIALGLAKAGADIIVHVGESATEGARLVDEISELGCRAKLMQADLLDRIQVTEMFELVRREADRNIHILVNNASIRPRRHLLDIQPEEWDRVIATNLTAPFLCTQQVLGGMIADGYGRIINISGADAVTGLANRAHNIAAKEGLIGLTRATVHDIREIGTNLNITCNALLPGVLDTNRLRANYPNWDNVTSQVAQFPIPRLGRCEEVADMCTFLASDRAAFITGQEIVVDGGAVIQPFFRA